MLLISTTFWISTIAGQGEDQSFTSRNLPQWYDPQTRERRGVYYTPEPVVKYIVRSVHELLKSRFNLPDGLAVFRHLTGPAAGTMTFPAGLSNWQFRVCQKYGEVERKIYRQPDLHNFYAFELMVAPMLSVT